jgi:transposase
MTAKRSDAKSTALREQGVLYPQPERITDRLFLEHPFFDARDLLQVRYELLRRVRVDSISVTEAASAFGLSRPTFYQLQSAFRADGLAGLLPHKRGPRGGHKLTEEVVAFLEHLLADDKALPPSTLAQQLFDRFALNVHPRSIERALWREKKR